MLILILLIKFEQLINILIWFVDLHLNTYIIFFLRNNKTLIKEILDNSYLDKALKGFMAANRSSHACIYFVWKKEVDQWSALSISHKMIPQQIKKIQMSSERLRQQSGWLFIFLFKQKCTIFAISGGIF